MRARLAPRRRVVWMRAQADHGGGPEDVRVEGNRVEEAAPAQARDDPLGNDVGGRVVLPEGPCLVRRQCVEHDNMRRLAGRRRGGVSHHAGRE